METKFMAEYHSALSSTSGCVHSFSPIGRKDQQFSPQVEHYCPLCERKHMFRLYRTHMVSTEGQLKAFLHWCETNQIQRGVQLD